MPPLSIPRHTAQLSEAISPRHEFTYISRSDLLEFRNNQLQLTIGQQPQPVGQNQIGSRAPHVTTSLTGTAATPLALSQVFAPQSAPMRSEIEQRELNTTNPFCELMEIMAWSARQRVDGEANEERTPLYIPRLRPRNESVSPIIPLSLADSRSLADQFNNSRVRLVATRA